MDDVYIIHPDKRYLKNLLKELKVRCYQDSLYINEKKTQIIKLSKSFNFLKVNYSFSDTGKIIQKASKQSIVRERRKLKKLQKKVVNNEIDFTAILMQFNSWLGSIKHFDSYNQIQRIVKLFLKLFPIEKYKYYDEKFLKYVGKN